MRQPIKNDHPGRFTPAGSRSRDIRIKSPTHCQLCYEGWLCWLNLTSSVGFCTAERRAQKLLVVGANSHALVRFWQRWITCYREQALMQEQECGPFPTFRRCPRESAWGRWTPCRNSRRYRPLRPTIMAGATFTSGIGQMMRRFPVRNG